MNSKSKLESADYLPKEFGGLESLYSTELDEAEKDLGALRVDLERLLVPIHAQSASRQQLPGLLKVSFSRLKELRDNQALVLEKAENYGNIVKDLDHAYDFLKSGDNFSLKSADEAFEKSNSCLVDNKATELSGLIFSNQAQIAKINQNYKKAADLYQKAANTPNLDAQSQWRLQIERASILSDLGREFKDNDALEQAVNLLKTVALDLAPQDERPLDWAMTQSQLGKTLGILGQRHRGTQLLENSIDAFEKALKERTREIDPHGWSATQNDLGNALGALAQRQGDKEMLAKSIEAFENALKERSEDSSPEEWASTQNNLGAALQSLGNREEGTKLLSKSVKAYTNVLKVWTRNTRPLNWATTLNNLGGVLRALGQRQSGTRSLEKSVAAYENSLKVRTRERVPQDWAMTQNNLGASLQVLGEEQSNTQMLEKSVMAYENALLECTQEKTPMGWAMTMANLGVARRTLAAQAKDVTLSRMAIEDFQSAVDVFREASHAQYVELCEEQKIKALVLMEELEGRD